MSGVVDVVEASLLLLLTTDGSVTISENKIDIGLQNTKIREFARRRLSI